MSSDDDLIVKFKDLEWEIPATGVRQKKLTKNSKQVRLIEFTDQLLEEEWCIKGHIGYVLEGELSIDFKGKVVHYVQGDGLWIMPDKKYAHKPMISKGKSALLLLFEDNLD